ncbi:MAG: hypothetical protein CMI67_09405 [Pelagibaca sp.]|nr:hypothetical protein [Pelagibaca sp.]
MNAHTQSAGLLMNQIDFGFDGGAQLQLQQHGFMLLGYRLVGPVDTHASVRVVLYQALIATAVVQNQPCIYLA